MMCKTVIFVVFSLICTLYIVDCTTSSVVGREYLEPYLNKKYELFSSDNFDAVMEALGVGIIKRKMGNLAKPVIELTEKDGEYTLSSKSVIKTIITKFRIGEEFDDITPDDREVKSIFTQDRNVLTQIQRGDKTVVIVREFTLDQVKVTVSVDDIVSIRIYRAL